MARWPILRRMRTSRAHRRRGHGGNDGFCRADGLGLAIGTDVQAYDAGLASIAGLTTAADKMIYTTAADTYAVASLDGGGAQASRRRDGRGHAGNSGVPSVNNIPTIRPDAAAAPPAGFNAETGAINSNDLPEAGVLQRECSCWPRRTLASSRSKTSGASIRLAGLPAGGSWRLVVMFDGLAFRRRCSTASARGPGRACQAVDIQQTVSIAPGTGSGFHPSDAGSAANTVHGSITLTLLNSSTNPWVAQIGASRSTTSAIGGGGGVVLSGALDRVRLTRHGTTHSTRAASQVWYR